ncbi:MAG: hypothetical protein M1813_007109 [Trichoglossum hirsutum]|nr:MAG: hypothetical protein M1813_007109 [Trichoglossum hirsutum]
MGRQYTTKELLRLRESPLVRKPDRLPPPEEWMGSQEQTLQNHQSQRTKRGSNNKSDESSFSNELAARRPSLFDQGRHISRTSIPEDIVLGPPKTSFASATSVRNFNKPFDSPDRSSFSAHDEEGPRTDPYNLREKFFKDRERSDRDTAGGRPGDFRSGGGNTRRGAREDGDEWTSVKPRRSFDEDRFGRRNGDRDRDNGRDGKERHTRNFDNHSRDKERDHDKEETTRRNLPGRGRNEPSWFNNESSTNSKEAEGSKDSIREREWRDKHRSGDSRDWHRGSRAESRPEWMDTPVGDESKTHGKKQSHTMEEFQRWKGRVGAGNGNAPPNEDKKKAPAEDETVDDKPPEAATQKTESSGQKFDTPLVIDTAEDKFFGLWNEPKQPSEDSGQDVSRVSSKKEVSRPSVGKSRFTSFFSPQEELRGRGEVGAPLSHTSPPPGSSGDSSVEDKEGFQRILQMLGGTSIDTAPSTQQMSIMTQKPSTQEMSHSQASTNVSSPIQGPTQGQGLGYHSLGQDQPYPPRSRNSGGIQGLMGPQSPQAGPQGGQPQNRDSEFLFRLMQQSRPLSGPPHLPSLSGQPLLGNSQGLPPPPQISTGPIDMPRGKLHSGLSQGGGMFDDSSITGFQRPALHQAPREPNGPPSRPPGLENVPQIWPSNPLGAPQSHHRQIAPPPGLNAQRGPPFAPFLPPPPGLPFQIPGMPPPNLPPPPGFFALNGMNGPPTGYPPMPFQPDGFMGMSGPGGHSGAGGPGVSQFPFAEGVNGANGRGAPPGQYRHIQRERKRRV